EAAVGALQAGPGPLVPGGEPGIGKTELWRAGAASARARGSRVLDARPAQAEEGLAFAALGDLLAGAREEIDGLAEPQRRSLAVALLLEEAGEAPADRHAVGVAVLA